MLLFTGLLYALCSLQLVLGWIPAFATNSSEVAVAGGLSPNENSTYDGKWYGGSYTDEISYQRPAEGSTGVNKGVLIHFSEDTVNGETPGTNTPWIALISCDWNATNASFDEDIFTLARSKGAVAALLHSQFSTACVLNPGYPSGGPAPLDIYSTRSLTSSRLMESQFTSLDSPKDAIISSYDAKVLNDAYSNITQSVELDLPVATNYIYAILTAHNSTKPSEGTTVTYAIGGPKTSETTGTTGTTSAIFTDTTLQVTGTSGAAQTSQTSSSLESLQARTVLYATIGFASVLFYTLS